MYFDQGSWEVRCEWGEEGLRALQGQSDSIVIVDVLSFSTCLCVAVERGATVFPYGHKEATAAEFARSLDALLAGPRGEASAPFSLSPDSLYNLPERARLVLPSPNGAMLSTAANGSTVFAGCLRNARAVAQAAAQAGPRVAIVAAGERWRDGSLRPSLEDWIGAGAIVHCLSGSRSPEAASAEALFVRYRDELESVLRDCSSGRQLVEMGFPNDVERAAELNACGAVPVLKSGAYVRL